VTDVRLPVDGATVSVSDAVLTRAAGDADALLAAYDLPEHAPVEQLRAVTRVAATVAGVPTAVINLLSDCFQHQVGEFGFAGGESPISDSMCAVALRDEHLRYLPDARREPTFDGNPWVDGRLASVALYASAPMVLPDGRVLGSLCVFSEERGHLSTAQLDALTDLADQAVTLFEQARLIREAAEQAARFRQARDEAERRGALTAAILDTIDVGIVACDADGRITLFNRAAREMHGVPEDPAVDPADWRGQYSLYAEDGTTPLDWKDIPLFRALGDGTVHDEVRVIAPTGLPPVTVRCDGRAMVDAAGRVLGAVLAQKDITAARAQARELTGARDQALVATRAKTAFLAAASHEIRTPLNGVLGMLEMLALDALAPHQHQYVEIARRSGEALLHLLNDVLDLSKAETTSVTLASEPFRPVDVVAEVVAALAPSARHKGLALELTGSSTDAVVGDPRRLRQVLMNLVGNAVKFTEHGRIDVDVVVSGTGELRVAVRDTGAGMSADEVSRLFQPFSQGAQGARHGGTGLGLALSRQLVELMGGRIDLASEPGSGSTFTVVVDLPLAAPRTSTTAAGPAPVIAPVIAPAITRALAPATRQAGDDRTRLRVLVADDNEINLMVASGLLAAEGADVITVADGDEAVIAVRDGAFDLVLLDLQMPRMSGLDAARAIRALPGPSAQTRLLALTADSLEESGAACSSAGMDGVLVKPVRGADVRRVLGELAVPTAR
jgi:signal transduction histidine kinase/CheY-like chemotaxis protein